MKRDAQLAFELNCLKIVPGILMKMPIRSRELPVLPYKMRPLEQGRYGTQAL